MTSFSPGASLGPYQVIAPLGAGGMGEVFKARDTRLDRIVALKILPHHLSSSEELRQRFEREARAISQLSHPHVCQLFDIGHESGISYLVMEYLEGENLSQRLAKGPIPLAETLKYAAQIAEALEAAHREGILHRDIKPGNVVITKTGAKLLDFGLAKNAAFAGGAGDLSASPTLTSPLTTEGTIVGTYQYIAPEVLEGQTADKRADIFGFGALLYEMISGQKAFHGKTQASVIAAVLEREPARVSALNPTTPARLEELVRACLLKDPDERRQSMHDIALELKSILAGIDDLSEGIAPSGGFAAATPQQSFHPGVADPAAPAPVDSSSGLHVQSGAGMPIPPPPAQAKGRAGFLPWIVALLSLATAGAFAWVYLNQPEPERRLLQVSILPPASTQFELNGVHPGPPALSPDGTRIAFSATDSLGNTLLYVRRLRESTARPLQSTEGAGYPFWSPDGKQIGFFADGKLKKVDAAGGPVLSLCDARRGKGGSWHASGSILFSPDHNQVIYSVPAAGGEPAAVTKLDSTTQENSHRFPVYLPDGEHFLYFARRDNGSGAIRLADFQGNGKDLVLAQSNGIYADGHLFYLRERTLMAHPFDIKQFTFTGDAFPVAESVEFLAGAAFGVFSVSEHGELAYLPDTDASLVELSWYERSGKLLNTLGLRDYYEDVSISPDGKLIAVEVTDPETGQGDIWVVEGDREIQTRLTFARGNEEKPVWSPDGTEIVYAAVEADEFVLYRKKVFGGAEKVEIRRSNQALTPLAWHPDGTLIICYSGGDHWIVPLDAEQEPYPWAETEFDEASAAFSSDGKWLAFSSNETGVYHAYVTAFPERGRKWQVSGAGGGGGPFWSGTRSEVGFINIENGMVLRAEYEVDGAELTFSRPEPLVSIARSLGGDVTDDGDRYLLMEQVGESGMVPLNLVINWQKAFVTE